MCATRLLMDRKLAHQKFTAIFSPPYPRTSFLALPSLRPFGLTTGRSGREILVSAGDGEFCFTMTEGKDFAVLLKSTLATDLREFNFFALSKLPRVPGFAANATSGSFNSMAGVSPKVTLTIESVAGIPYQVEESANLAGWITRTPPVLGTGGEISSTFEATSTGNRFYRWKLLPLEESP